MGNGPGISNSTPTRHGTAAASPACAQGHAAGILVTLHARVLAHRSQALL
ncbi:hypothetical protein [Spirillospora sp. CA-128828]